jgi:hypothetical protein
MAENHPPRRLGHNIPRSGEPFPDDRERVNRARQAAEALFAPKPRTAAAPASPAGPDSLAGPGSGKTGPASEQLIPAAPSRPPAVREAVVPPTGPKPAPGSQIPASQLARIRTWVKYGMTVAEVAKVYGVPADAIERALREA